jgi:VIT1/CCC1 family predicted Fe2+/Mn2+ transporter
MDLKKAMGFYKNEMKDAQSYEYLGRMEKDKDIRNKLLGLSHIERSHAEFWKKFIEKRGGKVEEVKIGAIRKLSLRIVRKILGAAYLVSLFEAAETSAINTYYDFYKNGEMGEEERRRLGQIILDEVEHERIFDKEKRILHAENIRDLVLGMNDGLVELLGAVTGLSAVYVHNPLIVGLSGLIVGVAGSLSMAIGTYVSVRSQRQVNEGTRKRLAIVLSLSEERAKKEVRDKLEEMGLQREIAESTAEIIVKNGKPESILPQEDVNEVRAALYTGIAYIIGVFFPVTPYFFAPNSYIALPISVFLAGTMLAIVSSIISVMSGISIKKKVAEMVVLGLGAAALSYAFGYLINYLFGGMF